jgi:TetR/AcrR family transcriptional regulator, regulator of cefoperazone and chloramphenicol sensitivity
MSHPLVLQSKSPESPTQERLLEAAGMIFAEHGFQNATVRDICQRAGANIAAINYHFGDKLGLYSAVLRYAHTCSGGPRTQADAESPEASLRAYVHSFVARLLDEGRPAWHAKLIAREMVEPTEVLDELVEASIRPNHDALMAIMSRLLGPAASPDIARRCVASVVGQCVFYHHCRPILVRLDPTRRFDAAEIERIAEHVVSFTLMGLKAYRVKGMGARAASQRKR